MQLHSGYEQRRARIEMLPLIDVVFLLLVFFVYAMLSMVLHRGLAVSLPEAESAQIDRRDFIAITLCAENRLWVNREEVPLEEVAGRVLALRADDADLPVYIEGDRSAHLGVAVGVLDQLRAVGITEISFSSVESVP